MGQEHSGSDIQPLIDKCDWSNLATALAYDRDLAFKLFEGQPPDANIFDAKTYKRILQGIDQIKGRYFAELSDSSTFTISTSAREMSAGQTSNHTKHRSWNFYSTFASLRRTKPSLKSRAYPASSDANYDETTCPINLKKAK